jgi:hypothetical protein
MSEYNVDFSNINSVRYLQPGIYRAWLAKVEEREGRQAPLFSWTFVDGTGAQSTITTSLADNALWKLQEVLMALGVDATGKLRLSQAKLAKLVGRSAVIEVTTEEGENGKTYSKISKCWKADAAEEQAPPPSDDGYDADFDNDPF